MSEPFEFSSPLFGASCPAPVRVGSVELRPTTWELWWFLEKSDVANEQAGRWMWSELAGDTVPVRPPPRLVSESADLDDWQACTEDHGLAVLGLRLAGATSFLDPEMTMSVATSGPFIQRRLGPYRMAGYSSIHAPGDLIDADTAARASELTGLVVARGAGTALLGPVMALSAPSLTPNAMVLIALQLVEGIFGRLAERIRGRRFDERLTAAGVPADLVAWMVGDAEESGRALRNAVAHGRSISGDGAARMAHFARVATCCFLEFPPGASGEDPVERFQRAAWP